jgi:hypothetical protein
MAMAEPEPIKLDSVKPKPRPRKPPTNGTVSPIKKAAAAPVKPADKGVVVEKVPAKKAVAKAAAPKVEKPVVLKDAEHPYYTRKGYAPAKGCQLYEAQGASGQIGVRSYKEPVVCAIDKSDDKAGRETDRLGCIFHMYPSNEAAEKVAAKLRADGYGAVIVEARPYRGQPGDPK